jgi:hypothetical protein
MPSHSAVEKRLFATLRMTTKGANLKEANSGDFQLLIQNQPLRLQPRMLPRQHFLPLPKLPNLNPAIVPVNRRISELRLDLFEFHLQRGHARFDLFEALALLL